MADTHGNTGKEWIGVDLDGTLAHYETWEGIQHIGKPIPQMVTRILGWLTAGLEVRIVTARVAPLHGEEVVEEARQYIQNWLKENLYSKYPVGFLKPHQIELKVTHEKDHLMLELWDDRCVQVVPNTGERIDRADTHEEAQEATRLLVLAAEGILGLWDREDVADTWSEDFEKLQAAIHNCKKPQREA